MKICTQIVTQQIIAKSALLDIMGTKKQKQDLVVQENAQKDFIALLIFLIRMLMEPHQPATLHGNKLPQVITVVQEVRRVTLTFARLDTFAQKVVEIRIVPPTQHGQ
jgi:hypothetical protein